MEANESALADKSHTEAGIRTKIIVGAVVAVFSALVGAYVNERMDRYFAKPRPDVLAVSFTLREIDPLGEVRSRADMKNAREVQVPVPVSEQTTENTWVASLRGTKRLPVYIAQLQEHRDTLKRVAQRIDDLNKALDSWPAKIESGNLTHATAVFDLLWPHAQVIRAYFLGQLGRGVTVFSGPTPAHSGNPVLNFSTDRDGDFSISTGVKMFPFAWTPTDEKTFGRLTRSLETQSRRFAEALAYCDPHELEQAHKMMQGLVATKGAHSELLELIDKELQKYSRLVANVVVRNGGRDPLSLSHRAALYVNTKGYKIADEDGVQRAVVHNAMLQLTRVTPRMYTVEGVEMQGGYAPLESPFIIAGGEAVTLVLQSGLLLDEHDDSDGLVQAFEEGAVEAKLVMAQFGEPGLDSPELVTSKPVRFYSLEKTDGFPVADEQWPDASTHNAPTP